MVERTAPVTLFWGEDEYLLRLAATAAIAPLGVEPTEVPARAWQGGELFDLATPSLWGERRALLVTGCQSLPESGLKELKAYLRAPAEDAVCVLTLVSAAGRPPALAKVVQAAGGAVRQIALKRQDLPGWVLDRARRRGVNLTPQGSAALVETLGEGTGQLDQAVEQLGTAFASQAIGPAEVARQFVGLGEQRVWDLCDEAFGGRAPDALVTLRGLLEGREDPLMILGVIASRARDLLRVRALPPKLGTADAARAAGLRFDWQLRRYRDQAARFGPGQLEDVHDLVVEADRQIKGGVPGDVALPTLVVAVAGHAEAGLRIPIRVSR
jgi:DNA polymerase III subunit delta